MTKADLERAYVVKLVFKNLERDWEGCAFRQADYLARSMCIHNGITIPFWSSKLGNAINVHSLNGASECARGGIMDARLLLYLAPPCTLAIEDANYSRTLVCIPDFEQAAMVLGISSLPLKKRGTKWKSQVSQTLSRLLLDQQRGSLLWGVQEAVHEELIRQEEPVFSRAQSCGYRACHCVEEQDDISLN